MPLQLRPDPPKLCLIGRYIRDADPADAKTIQAWLDDPTIYPARLAASLTDSGMRTSDKSVMTHRSGRCGCGTN